MSQLSNAPTRTFEKFLDQFLRPFECFFQNDGLEPFSKFSNIFQIFHWNESGTLNSLSDETFDFKCFQKIFYGV